MSVNSFTSSINVKIFLSIVLLLSLFSAISHAKDDFLLQSLKIAQSRNAKLNAAYQQIEMAQLRTVNAARSFFPQIILQHSSSKGNTALAAPGSSYIAGEPYEYQSRSYGVKIQQPIYEGHKIKALYDYENMMVTAAKYNYTKEREELFFNIKRTYYEYLTTKKEFSYLKEAAAIVESLLIKINNEYKAKAIAQLDVLEAENFRDKIMNSYSASKTNLSFSVKKFLELARVSDFSEIKAVPASELPDDLPEINYTLKQLLNFVLTNNVEVQIAKIQTEMADLKIIISQSKIKPKIGLEGFYGKSGEAFTTEQLELTSSWNVVAKLTWGLWGNSFESSYTQDKTDPDTIIDASRRIDTTTYDVKLSLLDDISYFVDSKESIVSFNQADSDYLEAISSKKIEMERQYNEYLNSLNKARSLRKEIIFRGRKVALMKKRNDLYEVSTMQLMDETWQYAEAVSNYAKSVLDNYNAVTEMEKLAAIPLR
ncbi:MAG: TolC family protein [Elusimicrobiota bacterium]|jgi:outer membrane protein TolC|nr:TolC family protein [Elusimicrobiota bacterium]